MVKIDLTSKRFVIYVIVSLVIGVLLIGGSYLVVDKMMLTTAFLYIIIAYPLLGIVRYIALLYFWRKYR